MSAISQAILVDAERQHNYYQCNCQLLQGFILTLIFNQFIYISDRKIMHEN